jgi:hypothetical protein
MWKNNERYVRVGACTKAPRHWPVTSAWHGQPDDPRTLGAEALVRGGRKGPQPWIRALTQRGLAGYRQAARNRPRTMRLPSKGLLSGPAGHADQT